MTRDEFHAAYCGPRGDQDSLNGRDDACYCFAFDAGVRHELDVLQLGLATPPRCERCLLPRTCGFYCGDHHKQICMRTSAALEAPVYGDTAPAWRLECLCAKEALPEEEEEEEFLRCDRCTMLSTRNVMLMLLHEVTELDDPPKEVIRLLERRIAHLEMVVNNLCVCVDLTGRTSALPPL